MTQDVILTEIKKLAPGESDILVMRLQEDYPPEVLQAYVKIFRDAGVKCVVLTIADDSDIYCIPEEVMARIGWQRIPT